MKDLGPFNYFVGIAVTHHTGGLFVSQKKYAAEIIVAPTCHRVSHLILQLIQNRSLVLLGANQLRIHLCIGDIQGHFNTLHSRDSILLMLYNRYAYSCMTRERSTCMLLNAFCATYKVL